jgi:FAD/FMN-containing dehydrogenase
MVKENAAYKAVFVKLAKIVGDTRVTKGPIAPPQIIVRPKTTDDVSRILKLAVKEGAPIFPKREMPWINLEKGTPVAIMLNTKDMNGIFSIDDENLAVTVGPGVVWRDLYNALSKRKYSIGAYPDSSIPTVGDWIDCGGAGIGSYSHGFAADQVRTMEVVLPDGKIIDTGFKKVLPNSSGYNLNGLFVGADSTLGVVTKVTLKMFPKPEETRPLYFTFSDHLKMVEALKELTKLKTTPLNVSFFGKNHLQFLKTFGSEVPPLGGMVVNVTLSGLKSVLDHDDGKISELFKKHGAIKVEKKSAGILWKERFFDLKSTGGGLSPIFTEVLVPLTKLQGMMDDTYELIDKMKVKAAIIGLISDRSTVAFTPYLIMDKKSSESSKVPALFAEKLGDYSLKYHGRPVGSTMFLVHGLKRVYGEGINTILDIKSAIDPHDIMNPQILK